ncbi:MAG: YdcF family protein [Hyphomicrobiaceae bacterium]
MLIWTAGLGTSVLVLGFILFAAAVTGETSANVPRADGIVVLTGRGEPRLPHAGRLLKEGKAHRLLVSGVNRRISKDSVRRLMKLDEPTFQCCVDVGYDAQDTAGNADETRAWVERLRLSSLIVVTSSYHMPRSLTEISLVLPEAQLHAYAVVPKDSHSRPWWLHFDTVRLLISEYVKFLPAAARYAATHLLRRANGGTADVPPRRYGAIDVCP